MDYVIRDGAPAALGRKGDVVTLTASQALYHELRGHVMRPSRLPPGKLGGAPRDEEPADAVTAPPRNRRGRKKA